MLRRFALKWGQIAVNHESLRLLVHKREIRLLATFVGVGLVLLAILLGGIGGTGSGAPAEAGLTTSAPQPVIREQASEDPVGYAIAEVQAGRVIGLEDDSSSSAVVEGKVLSRNGEIVLVEVTRVAGDKKTFATLLLQKMEGGWRTRDVFDAAN